MSAKSKSKKGDRIPLAVIKRLPIYHSYLSILNDKGVERISSRNLAGKIGITASQLRQDLSWFGRFGQQGYGYRVSQLLDEIKTILGVHQQTTMVLVGAGNIGRAMIAYPGFKERGFTITAVFDAAAEKVGTPIGDIFIRPISELNNYLSHNRVDIGIITVPVEVAQETAENLIKGGVRALWNFAPINLRVPDDVATENVHIGESLLTLSFKLQNNAQRQIST